MADQKGGSGSQKEVGIILLVICIAGAIALIWYYHAADIRNLVRWVRYGEMWLMSWFISDHYKIMFNGAEVKWRQGFNDAPHWNYKALTYQHLSYFTALAIGPVKWLYAAFFSLAGLWCLLFGPQTNNRVTLGLEGLIHRQARNFPVIAPFVKFNPVSQPPRAPGSPVPAELPLFAEALGPEEWIAYNSIPVPDGKLDEAAAMQAFTKQLGDRWRGANALQPYQQILLAAFCLKASRKRKEADEMLGRIARCWQDKGLNIGRDRTLLRDAQKILRNKDLAARTLAEANRHAYVTTAMLRALAFARSEGGVMAPAQFVWLRGHDRVLWYPMNNLGRQSFHMEAMGAMAHYKAEKMTQRPIPAPKVGDALQTIKEYMASSRARPIPPLDYSQSKKRGVKAAA